MQMQVLPRFQHIKKALDYLATYIESGKNGSTNGNLLESLISAELAKKMIEKKK